MSLDIRLALLLREHSIVYFFPSCTLSDLISRVRAICTLGNNLAKGLKRKGGKL